jgi:inner membrane protein
MDPLTHGLVGAAASQTAASEKSHFIPASIAGFIAAMMADLDIFIHSPGDPLFNIEVHRQFTHALIFIPVGALVAAGLLWWFFKSRLTFKRLYLYCFVAYGTSGLLDAFTSYGTQLLWPFLDTRFAWNLISVVDPLLTAGLIGWIAIALWKRERTYTFFAWGWLILFLIFGWVQNQRSADAISTYASDRGHIPEQMVVKPTIGNQFLWRANYIYDGQVYTYGVRAGLFSGITVYEGEASAHIIPEEDFSDYKGTTLFDDLKRFEHLSEGFLVRHPDKPYVIGDGRYSMLPTSMIPLWGVETDTTQTDKHLPFLYFRDASPEIRSEFTDMLLGR